MSEHDILSIVWYVILAVAWTVYLIQESFMVGSGMLHRFAGGWTKQRSTQISSGLHYDGIEVWLITAVGGTFAAFPPVFATILSSLYVPFFLLLAALILRAISIELMHKDESSSWRTPMSWIWTISSFLIPLVLGVYFANIFRGIATDASGYKGWIFELFDLTGLAGGIFFVANALVAGHAWIKFTTVQADDAKGIARAVPTAAAGTAVISLIVLFLGLNNKAGFFATGLYAQAAALWAVPVLAIVAGVITFWAAWTGREKIQFVFSLATMFLAMAGLFAAAFPRMVISRIDPAWGITAASGSSSDATLEIMTVVAAIFVPIVIGYQLWKYVHFRKDKNEEA